MKTIVLTLLFSLALTGGAALAQDVATETTVTAADLGVGEPNILPDSPLYFFKELGRNIRSFFTFDSVAKTALHEQISSEKLIELQKMVEENSDIKKLADAIKNYRDSVGDAEKAAARIRETAQENTQVGQFLDKFIQQQTLHQSILQQLETQVSTTTMAIIQEARENHLEKFGQVMTRLEDKMQLQERLEKNMQQVNFNQIQNAEILDELKAKVTTTTQGIIQRVQEGIFNNLRNTLKELPAKSQENFQEYLQNLGGKEENRLQIINQLKDIIFPSAANETTTATTSTNQLQQTLQNALENVKMQMMQKMNQYGQ
jgi:hypothetical protein